ncbi:MAG: DUF4874 domain-containing protein [Balneolales bacterium]
MFNLYYKGLRLSTLIFFLLIPVTLRAQLVFTYTESDEIIANPERGLQKYSITNSSYYSNSNYSNISESTLTGWRTGSEKVTVIYRYFLLGDFLESDISETYLNNIQLDFDRIRNTGLKCLVRFILYQSTVRRNPAACQGADSGSYIPAGSCPGTEQGCHRRSSGRIYRHLGRMVLHQL